MLELEKYRSTHPHPDFIDRDASHLALMGAQSFKINPQDSPHRFHRMNEDSEAQRGCDFS